MPQNLICVALVGSTTDLQGSSSKVLIEGATLLGFPVVSGIDYCPTVEGLETCKGP